MTFHLILGGLAALVVLALGWTWAVEARPRTARRDLGPGWPAPVERWTSGLAGGYAHTNVRPLAQRLVGEGVRPGPAVAWMLAGGGTEGYWVRGLAREWGVPDGVASLLSPLAWAFSPRLGSAHRRYLAFMDDVAKELETMERRA